MGKAKLEKVVAENRMMFNIFTSLSQPNIKANMKLSELCQCSGFLGVWHDKEDSDSPPYRVTNAAVYDIKNLSRLHPGGEARLELYWGMDATKAWEAVKLNKAPEVVAMLEMFDKKMTLRNIEAGLSTSDRLWYVSRWKSMTILVVEI